MEDPPGVKDKVKRDGGKTEKLLENVLDRHKEKQEEKASSHRRESEGSDQGALENWLWLIKGLEGIDNQCFPFNAHFLQLRALHTCILWTLTS